MLAADYTSHANLTGETGWLFRAAQSKGWLNEKTIVVLPEYLGTWLVAAGEKPGIYAATNVQLPCESWHSTTRFVFGAPSARPKRQTG
jgi:hypothetical protein